MIENWEELVKAAELLFDQNDKLSVPVQVGGITGTSIGLGEHGIGIIVHIESSKAVFDALPDEFMSFNVYKKWEGNKTK
jgi:hypothetical protein